MLQAMILALMTVLLALATLWGLMKLDNLEAEVESYKRCNDVLTEISKVLHVLGSMWIIRPLRWATILILLGFKRFRALFGMLGSIILVGEIVDGLALAIGRVRPFVEMIGEWDGYSHPSRPVAALAATLTIMGLALIPRGRWRRADFAGDRGSSRPCAHRPPASGQP